MTSQLETKTSIDFAALGKAFGILGDLQSAQPWGTGHINDTFAASYNQAGIRVRYIHQRINSRIFREPERLMENIQRVTRHQAFKLADDTGAPSRRHLHVLESNGGTPYYIDNLGAFWRTYLFIEGAQTYDVIEKPEQAYHAARAFGEFQGQLADLPGSPLHETIPFFHHTPRRVEKFEKALEFADPERRKTAEEEIKYARAQSRLAGHLLSLGLPVRVTHNDTKLNNVMLDASTGQAVCVIDLDTVMPGLVAYDFGDMVRTATMPVKEDERDVTKVVMQWPMFAALAQGYIEGSREFLTRAEAVQLSFAGWLMTFEVGIRFLTDYLEGDVYFKVHRPGHNLDRCRTQFALARDIDHNLLRMETFVRGLL